MRTLLLALAAMTTAAGAARAEVVKADGGMFRLRNTATVSAPPEKVYAALGEVGRWWNGAHSYSGDAANLTLDLKPGGCFCEALEDGGVRHGVVDLAWPGRTLRLSAALGPLQDEAVAAALTWQITPKDGGTVIVQTYHVGGGRPDLAQSFAPVVDQVMTTQFDRLVKYLETGAPD